jgi:solute carrier family 15 oligopeptide transporter 1
VYLHTKLGFDQNISTALFHACELLTFIVPVFAAIALDSCWGVFNTILSGSIVFTLGSAIMALSAFESLNLPKVELTLFGMFIFIAIGCVRSSGSAFGGDQYKLPDQAEALKKFFFYHMIFVKIGALIGRFVNPILREDVKCFGMDSCYPLAFGTPAICMSIVIAILICVRSKFVRKTAAENMCLKVIKCVIHAVKEKLKNKDKNKKIHWLDYATESFGSEHVESTKVVLRITKIFLGVSIYWSCFLQQNSRWIFQASKMNGDLGFYKLKPDQIITFNPLTALILNPLCNFYLYPLLSKIGVKTLLDRMIIGGYICCLSFVFATVVEFYTDHHYISMLWLLPQYTLSALSEILVVVSQLNFAYSEAPANMRTVMTAMVFLTTALGDSLISIVSASNIFKQQGYEFIFYICLLFVNMINFTFMARRYEGLKKSTFETKGDD